MTQFPVLGLAAPTFLGSVFVDVTSGPDVQVEVGDRKWKQRTSVSKHRRSVRNRNLQFAGSALYIGGRWHASIKSDGPLNITDPNPDPVSSKRSLTQTQVVSEQSVDVQNTFGDLAIV